MKTIFANILGQRSAQIKSDAFISRVNYPRRMNKEKDIISV